MESYILVLPAAKYHVKKKRQTVASPLHVGQIAPSHLLLAIISCNVEQLLYAARQKSGYVRLAVLNEHKMWSEIECKVHMHFANGQPEQFSLQQSS